MTRESEEEPRDDRVDDWGSGGESSREHVNITSKAVAHQYGGANKRSMTLRMKAERIESQVQGVTH